MSQVLEVLERGETIESYPDDKPYPSRLVMGRAQTRPLHVVVAENSEASEAIVITVYEPSATEWEPDFKRRKPR